MADNITPTYESNVNAIFNLMHNQLIDVFALSYYFPLSSYSSTSWETIKGFSTSNNNIDSYAGNYGYFYSKDNQGNKWSLNYRNDFWGAKNSSNQSINQQRYATTSIKDDTGGGSSYNLRFTSRMRIVSRTLDGKWTGLGMQQYPKIHHPIKGLNSTKPA